MLKNWNEFGREHQS